MGPELLLLLLPLASCLGIFWQLGLIADDATRVKFEELAEFLCDFAEEVEG